MQVRHPTSSAGVDARQCRRQARRSRRRRRRGPSRRRRRSTGSWPPPTAAGGVAAPVRVLIWRLGPPEELGRSTGSRRLPSRRGAPDAGSSYMLPVNRSGVEVWFRTNRTVGSAWCRTTAEAGGRVLVGELLELQGEPARRAFRAARVPQLAPGAPQVGVVGRALVDRDRRGVVGHVRGRTELLDQIRPASAPCRR